MSFKYRIDKYEASDQPVVVVPDDVVAIGARAFANHRELQQVVLPSGLREIDRYAFRNCENLQQVVLPASLRTIAEGAFWNCSALATIEIPAAVGTLEESAFSRCTALRQVHAAGNVTRVGDRVFAGCTSLADVQLGATRTVGVEAFRGCASLESMRFAKGLRSLGAGAFRSCTLLQVVEIPDTCTTVGPDAFADCPQVQVQASDKLVRSCPDGFPADVVEAGGRIRPADEEAKRREWQQYYADEVDDLRDLLRTLDAKKRSLADQRAALGPLHRRERGQIDGQIKDVLRRQAQAGKRLDRLENPTIEMLEQHLIDPG